MSIKSRSDGRSAEFAGRDAGRAGPDAGLALLKVLLVGAILLLAALAVAPGCSRQKRPNILWITVDSLRPDHLGCYGYHRARSRAMDGLAEEGFRFQTCIAQAPYTHLSVPSMITGKYPRLAGVKAAGQDLDTSHTTLAEILLQAGYRTAATPMGWKKGINRGFQRLYPVSRSSTEKTQWCLQFLDESDERPFFIWLYYWDPHLPYTPPREFMRIYEPDYLPDKEVPEGRPLRFLKEEQLRDPTGHYAGRIEVLNRINEGRIQITEEDREHLINLYDAEVALVDSEIDKVLNELRERGLWDNTLVVLNADHGEGFGEHGRYYHGLSLYEDQIRVPLILKPSHPERGGRTIQGTVRNLDIMPTILDFCDLEAPSDVNGQSLRPFIEKGSAPRWPSCLETSGCWKGAGSEFQLVAIRRDGHKLIGDPLRDHWELYDLSEDPGEEHDLLDGPTDQAIKKRAADLRQELFSTLKVESMDQLRLSLGEMQLDRGTRQRLRALGYIN
jgi:arylsulfatase A-like enzyme